MYGSRDMPGIRLSGGCGAQLACQELLQGSEMDIENQVPWIYYW